MFNTGKVDFTTILVVLALTATGHHSQSAENVLPDLQSTL